MNPYENLPSKAFWRTAIAEKSALQIAELWNPKWPIKPAEKLATAGSCFAQHIGRALQDRGYAWIDGEPAPPMMSPESRRAFNYGIFSFRTGNIYTAALLLQWVRYALDGADLLQEVWEQKGRFFDPLRPQIEPGGFASREECLRSREVTRGAMQRVLRSADLLVFTMGLTEEWIDAETGLVYPSCPGTIAGEFDRRRHIFRNSAYPEIFAAMTESFDAIKIANPDVRFLLTVSPVPLTATGVPGRHVLTANTHSKSVLRAVAGALCDCREDTDYFPSYEIITAVPYRGIFYEGNLRSVAPEGVNFVIANFMACLEAKFGTPSTDTRIGPPLRKQAWKAPPKSDSPTSRDDVVCEEEILEFYNAH